MLTKITQLRELLIKMGAAERVEIVVDGGMTTDGQNARACVSAGAKGFVVGSALFREPKGPAAAISRLREAVAEL